MISVTGVSKRFVAHDREVWALQGIDLRVGKGELVAVTGPSGSGKSTLLFAMGGLSEPTAGEVTLDGLSLYAMPASARAAARRAAIGFVFQTFNLLPYLTALENVALPALLAGKKRRSALAMARDLLARVGLGSRSEHRPAQLSVGERQRAAVARAVVNDARLILADEPTGNLDTEAGDGIFGLLDQVRRDGRSVVVVTHDPRLAARADRVIQLRAGRLTAGPTLAGLAS